MSLKTKLIVSFLLLSVVPLTALVLYSYSSSISTLRQVALEENTRLAAEMSERVELVGDDLSRRFTQVSRLELSSLIAEEGESEPQDRDRVLDEVAGAIGEVAPFVSGLEFTPTPGALAPWPRADAAAGATAPRARTRSRLKPLTIHLDSQRRARIPTPPTPRAPQRPPAVGIPQGLEIPHLPQATAEIVAVAQQIALAAAEAAGKAGGLRGDQMAALVTVRQEDLQHQLQAEIQRDVAEQDARFVEAQKVFGKDFGCAVTADGEPIGHLKVQLSAVELLKGVLSLTRRDRGEIPFAIDQAGALYAAQPEDLAQLERLGLPSQKLGAGQNPDVPKNWALVKIKDPRSNMTYGIARPLEGSIETLRSTALRNFIFGLGLVALALVGIAPLSGRITRGFSDLTAGVEMLAAGNLDARVPVRGQDEVARLATTFNRMAADLKERELQLLEQERQAKEHELERRLLGVENDRKSAELEEARRFQLSLLPKRLPEVAGLKIAVYMRTATEVGGDYYDFLPGPDGALTIALGDATGHGAKAGTLVTAAKSLFMARGATSPLTDFLAEANRAIKGMELGRMAMAMTLARIEGSRLTVAAAGMPPALLHRAASGQVEEIAIEGLPLGSLADCHYREVRTTLDPGDTLLMMSDGFPELRDAAGEPLGYGNAQAIFAASAAKPPDAVIADLAQAVTERKAGAAPDDDVTFVVLKVRS